MATFNQGILGPFSGVVGPVVGSTCHGKFILRARPTPKKNPTYSPKQLIAQKRMTAVGSFLKNFSSLIALGFLDVKSHAYSAAVKENFKHLETDDDGNVLLNIEAVSLSNGDLDFPVSATKADSAASFKWTAPSASDVFHGGQLCLAAYNVANKKARNAIADLSAGSLDFDFSSILTGTDDDDVHIYFFAATSEVSSPTTHLND